MHPALVLLIVAASTVSASLGPKTVHHGHSHRRRAPVETGSLEPRSSGAWWKASSHPVTPNKWVFAHLLVGNTYSYTHSEWVQQIELAHAQGIDAFALNLGTDSWQPGQVASAYAAAESSGTGFKLFLSFDMTVISCGDTTIIPNNIAQYHNHPSQMKAADGSAFVSTFGGGAGCKSNDQWAQLVKDRGINTHFVPAFFDDVTSQTLKSMYPSIDGDFLWGAAWPQGDYSINWANDAYRVTRNGLSRPPGTYMTSVSPHFSVHFPGRNYIWDSDNHLYIERWNLLIENRNEVDAVEIISWNDCGESTYIGPIPKDCPAGSQAWTEGFEHQGWLDMTGFFVSQFKRGVQPTIIKDRIYVWARAYGVNDNPTQGDPVGRPQNADWVEDKLWIVLFATGSGSLSVSQGSVHETHAIVHGVNRISQALGVGESVTAMLTRNGKQVFKWMTSMPFSHEPPLYNFNARVAYGP